MHIVKKNFYRISFMFLGAVLVINCGNNNSSGTSNSSQGKYEIIEISKTDFFSLKEKGSRIELDTSKIIKKHNGLIKLPLDNGSFKFFSDTLINTDNADKREYSHLGIIQSTGIYVIFGRYYETSEYILINKANGSSNIAWDKPLISPDKKYIATASAILGYIMFNGIQIFKNEDSNLSKIIEVEFKDFEPQELTWISSNSLIFMQVFPEDYNMNKKEEVKYAKLILK